MILELNQSFRGIKYFDFNHSYIDIDSGCRLESVTTVLKRLKPEYNTRYWSLVKSLQRSGYDVRFEHNRRKNGFSVKFPGYTTYTKFDTDSVNIEDFNLDISPAEIKQEWDMLAKSGTSLGSFLHQRIENNFYRKEINYPLPEFITGMTAIEAGKYLRNREILSNMADSFYNEMSQKYIPIAMEFVVGDADLGVAGQFDAIFLNLETEEYELWDYKTDKDSRYSNPSGQKIDYFGIDDAEMPKYSIQLGMYKYLIEKHTGYKISKSYICHFQYRTNTYQVLETNNYDDKIKEYFNGKNKPMDK